MSTLGFGVVGLVVLSVLAGCCQEAPPQGGGYLRTDTMDAEDAYEKGMGAFGVQRGAAGKGIVLYETTLVEDDGPGAGSDAAFLVDEDRSPSAVVDVKTQLKKILVVDRPEVLDARLYVRPGKADVEFNGTRIDTSVHDKFFRIPAELIKKGENVIVLSAKGEVKTSLKVAARKHILQNEPDWKDRPPRSFQSADGGKTWAPIDGELTIRLSLHQYAGDGHFLSPVIDLTQGPKELFGSERFEVDSVTVNGEADTPKGTSVDYEVRLGTSPVYDPATWGTWLSVNAPMPWDKRFLQWKAILRTQNPKATPTLKAVVVRANVSTRLRPAWVQKVAVKELKNPEIRYTSMPFEYEDPNHPRMVALRQKYKLEDVVKGGKTEFEKQVMLRNWLAHQFKFRAPEKNYPAWDADEIMTRKIGFCVQFAIAYIQCATSLGYQARYVCGYHEGTMKTAHEVAEVWSDDFQKWIFMDPTPSQNLHGVDPKTNEPLSMLETHDRMVRTYYGDEPATDKNIPKVPKWSELIANCRELETTPGTIHKLTDPAPKDWPSWTKWLVTCYMPRNNFYAKPTPLPRIQGWNLWDWTGFRQWYDGQVSRDWRYRHHLSRRSDLAWTINQVRFAVAAEEREGVFKIHMGTFTPYFDTFLVNVGGQGWKKSDATFSWTLKPGHNRIEMRARNTSGVEGPMSFMDVEY